MFYEFDFAIPPSTAEASAAETRIKLQHGVLVKASVQFPSGCAGLARMRVIMGGTQIWPRNLGGSMKGDGFVVPIDEYIELHSAWNELTVRTWNDDDTYSHTLTLRIMVLPREVANLYAMFSDIRNALVLLLRRIGVFG